MRRTKLVVYCYFNNLTLAFNVPPALVNSEIEIDLPCSEGEWTAPPPEALAEHRRRSPTSTSTFSEVLENLLSPIENPPIACSTFGSYIMIHALLLQIWHIRQASLYSGSKARQIWPSSSLLCESGKRRGRRIPSFRFLREARAARLGLTRARWCDWRTIVSRLTLRG